MESSSNRASGSHVIEGEKRAARIRTRAQTKKLEMEEAKRELEKGGLTQNQYWEKFVRSREDIVKFYSLYYPDYPECLAKSIAERVGSIIDKSRRGEKLTEDEAAYIERSNAPSPYWDPLEEIQCHEKIAKVNLTIKKLEELKTE